MTRGCRWRQANVLKKRSIGKLKRAYIVAERITPDVSPRAPLVRNRERPALAATNAGDSQTPHITRFDRSDRVRGTQSACPPANRLLCPTAPSAQARGL